MSKFKNGDIVIAHKNAPYVITRDGWKGKVVGIKYGCDEDIRVTNCEGFSRCSAWVSSKHFDLVVDPKSVVKFKVGDCVIGNPFNTYSITKTGWVGKVTATNGSYISVTNCDGYTAYSGDVKPQFFDLFKPEEHRFKVGDKVVANKYLDAITSDLTTGWIGRVTDIKNETQIAVVADGKPTDVTHIIKSAFFDNLKTPEKKKAKEKKAETPDKTTMSNAEAFEMVFGFLPSMCDCPCGSRCADCPFASENGGDCNDSGKWKDMPYTGRFAPMSKKALFHRVKTGGHKRDDDEKQKIRQTFCIKFNDLGDSEGLKLLKEQEFWTTEKQYQDLNTLLLMNELIFTHNSETVSETAYNILLISFLASIGIGIDKSGMAFVRTDVKQEVEDGK